MNTFPIYLLKLGDKTTVVFPEDKVDIGHTEFWETVVSHVVARYYRIPQVKLANLPYCQRRARIVGDNTYYGETHTAELLDLIRQAVGNKRLAFFKDDHEKRLREDVREFRKLVSHYRPKSTMT